MMNPYQIGISMPEDIQLSDIASVRAYIKHFADCDLMSYPEYLRFGYHLIMVYRARVKMANQICIRNKHLRWLNDNEQVHFARHEMEHHL